ncbi:uncharacterized protein PRCAT00004271001 [Priceomyces carsonii]|uniref:uncharacterized protein n=1 Tax=Priceomyces carsonii TaxID=28549 RepID=UPI002ED8DE78|nr:unnamed protein product [Priceomyces carsonii]
MTKNSFPDSGIDEIKSIAIIGAGPCGTGALKAFIKEGRFGRIQAFEKRPDLGGLWNYTVETDEKSTPVPCESPSLDIDPVFNENTGNFVWPSPVYDYLDTNVPKEIMTYVDEPFSTDLPIFPHRSDVLEYMKHYATELNNFIRFNTKVVHIDLLNDNKWKVISRPVVEETNGGKISSRIQKFEDKTEIFDAVVIATGNYDIPYIPNRQGMEEWNSKHPGTISHVKSYRNPKTLEQENGEILVVGNSASAGDLAYQLATTLKRKIYKSKRSENQLPTGKSNFVMEVADIKRFDADSRSIYLEDGSKLENVSRIIFATGYLKSFPFMDHFNRTQFPLLTDGNKVHGIYEQIILYNYPNLAIIGLPRFVLPTRNAETQACWLSKVWSGKIKLPSVEYMRDLERKRVEDKGSGKKFHDLIFPEDVLYSNLLNSQIFNSVKTLKNSEKGLLPKVWDKEQIKIRGSIKAIKESYIIYKERTGKLAKSVQELEDAKITEPLFISDEELRSLGFDF